MAILISCLAAAFLVRRAWRVFVGGGAGKCGSCPSCGSADTIKSRPLVDISLDKPHAKPQSRQG